MHGKFHACLLWHYSLGISATEHYLFYSCILYTTDVPSFLIFIYLNPYNETTGCSWVSKLSIGSIFFVFQSALETTALGFKLLKYNIIKHLMLFISHEMSFEGRKKEPFFKACALFFVLALLYLSVMKQTLVKH